MAVYLQRRGLRVLLVDADPETTAEWIAGDGPGGVSDIRFAKMTGDIRADLLDQENLYQAIVVDCGGHDSQTMHQAMAAASHIIIPFRPKRRDLKLVAPMAELATLVRAVNPPA